MDTEADSVRQLAKLVGRSPKTVLGWTKRDDWPFARTPPWPAMQAIQMVEWADAFLQEDRAEHRHRNSAPVAQMGKSAHLAEPKVSLRKFLAFNPLDKDCPFNVADAIGNKSLVSDLTVADLDEYVAWVSYGLSAFMLEESQSRGQDGLPMRATAAIYADLLTAPDPPKESGRRPLMNWLNLSFAAWVDERLQGRKKFQKLVERYVKNQAAAEPTAAPAGT